MIMRYAFTIALGMLLCLVAGSARASAQSVLSVRIWPEKSDYLLGEPVRIAVLVCNRSHNRVLLSRQGYYAITPPGDRARISEEGGSTASGIELAPLDSTLYFLYCSSTLASVGGRFRTVHRFDRVGDYTVRIATHGFLQKRTDVGASTGGEVPRVWSNAIRIRVTKARPREARVFEALRRAHADGNSYSRTWSMRWRMEDDNLALLRTVSRRHRGSPSIGYVDYAIARMLLDAMTGRITEPRDLHEGVLILESVRERFPDFRPDEVSYFLALGYLRADQANIEIGRSTRDALGVMDKLLHAQPELQDHPEIAFLAKRVKQTGEEIELRLSMDKQQYVLGEPMLFRISMVNRSTQSILVCGSAGLSPDGDGFCGYIEIERPDGVRELWTKGAVSTNRSTDLGIWLAPGDSLSTGPTYKLTSSPFDQWGYVRPPGRAFSKPGNYRVSAGLGVPEWAWSLAGAGRLVLSRSVEISVRAPEEREAVVLGALDDATKRTVLRSFIRDAPAFDAVQAVIDTYPDEVMTFYLRRAVAMTWRNGLKHVGKDEHRSLQAFKMLEDESVGLRRRELQLQRLNGYADLARSKGLVGEHRRDAEALIHELEEADPTLWATTRFCWDACYANLAEYGGEAASCASKWWLAALRRGESGVPSWDDLRAVAAAVPPRGEKMGPFQPRPKPRRLPILR